MPDFIFDPMIVPPQDGINEHAIDYDTEKEMISSCKTGLSRMADGITFF